MSIFEERQIRLVHELMYQIRVEEAMTKDVISFPPSATFREIQLCLKKRRFSGAPIVDENNHLLGIISIDDILTAFDVNLINCPVESFMTQNLITIPRAYSVITASNLFQKHKVGRLPVVESSRVNKLVGILTFGDILTHLLFKMNALAESLEARERDAVKTPPRQKPDKLRFELAPDNFERAGIAATQIKKYLKGQGVPSALIRRIAVICYEAELNVIIHSLGGYIEMTYADNEVNITVVDDGPGIPDLEEAMRPGYTTANEKIRALGFGAGMGLVNIKRCADTFDLRSEMGKGTELKAKVILQD